MQGCKEEIYYLHIYLFCYKLQNDIFHRPNIVGETYLQNKKVGNLCPSKLLQRLEKKTPTKTKIIYFLRSLCWKHCSIYFNANSPQYFHTLCLTSVLSLSVRRCSPLFPPDNGYMKCDSDGDNYGATCNFKCIGGYELQGSAARVCQYGLTWSGTDTTCTGRFSSQTNALTQFCFGF